MSEWYWVLLFAVGGGSFLMGRWRGIRDFEKGMSDIQSVYEDLKMADLLKEAKHAIDAVFSDTSVASEVTLERLEELEEDISSCKAALKEL